MNDEHIDMAHQFNKKIIEEFKVVKGLTKMTVRTYNGIEERTVEWINPQYGWFGSNDPDHWILPESIETIDGVDVKGRIEEIRKSIYTKEAMDSVKRKHEDILFRKTNPF